MYNVIYDDLVDAGIAVYREKPVFTDREGNNVNESDRFGLIQDILITHPHYLIFADKSGFNTPRRTTEQLVEKGWLWEQGRFRSVSPPPLTINSLCFPSQQRRVKPCVAC